MLVVLQSAALLPWADYVTLDVCVRFQGASPDQLFLPEASGHDRRASHGRVALGDIEDSGFWVLLGKRGTTYYHQAAMWAR